MSVENKFTNRLSKETSPYLLQHAHNPVDWYPWGEEAFSKAKQENKPIFLSVGYSACHWCHVMEHESFEDEETAKMMNELYINIKVDREERPDVDTIYMSVVQLLTGQGGWPMSVFLTPDQKPFFGGTYFPKERRYGMPSFKELLSSVHRYYGKNKEELDKNIGSIMHNLQILNNYQRGQAETPSEKIITNTLESIADYHDSFNGGFGDKPKFPNTFNLDLLLRQYQKSGKKIYLEMVETTLRKMANGGIYDQIGGGFFRYSVDEYWLIPHFEKMLYDNALLIKNLLEIYQVTGDSFFRKKARESLDYVLREMTAPEGGFYSTQDADSEGEEGKYYVWTPVEIKKIAGEKEGGIFCDYFGVTDYGNFEHGKSNLHVSESVSHLLKKYQLTETEFEHILQNVREKLFIARQERIPPGKDTKIITAWNGLMISAFAKGYAIFAEPVLLATAEKTVNFIENTMFQEGFLLRTYKDQQAKYNGYLEDYAFLINSLLDLYQVCLKEKYLDLAENLTKIMVANFWDEQEGGFFYTGKNHESLIVRTKEITDHSIPSANAVAINALWRIARLVGNKKWEDLVGEALQLFSGIVRRYSLSVTGMVCTIDSYLNPPLDLVLVSEDSEQLQPFLKKVNNFYQPDLLIHYPNARNEKNDLYKGKVAIEGKPTAYLCKNFTCLSPLTDPEALVFS